MLMFKQQEREEELKGHRERRVSFGVNVELSIARMFGMLMTDEGGVDAGSSGWIVLV